MYNLESGMGHFEPVEIGVHNSLDVYPVKKWSLVTASSGFRLTIHINRVLVNGKSLVF